MMPAAYVKAYVKRNKTDAADAEAICEAATRPTMRFVPIKTPDEQAACMVLKTRELFVHQRTQASNAIRAHMAELGIITATGMASIDKLTAILRDEADTRLPVAARAALLEMAGDRRTVGPHRGVGHEDRQGREGRRDGSTPDEHSRRRPDHRGDRPSRDPGSGGLPNRA